MRLGKVWNAMQFSAGTAQSGSGLAYMLESQVADRIKAGSLVSVLDG